MSDKIVAIVPAAGLGTRLGDARPKQYLDLNGQPMIHHTLAALAAVRRIARIFAVLAPGDLWWDQFDWRALNGRVEVLRCGGAQRGETVLNALGALGAALAPQDWVLVHDAARPCIRRELIDQFLDELESDAVGGLLALPVSDTLKSANESQRVDRTVPRERLWRAQTPQMFRAGLLRSAMQARPDATDEAQAIEALGHAPKLVAGDSANLKVTYASDLKLADILLKGV
ncbi:MAG: 2-C-methyl-D-erythritol 4-phosphate cytidylyltransferase [Betaproteobacteria bacterium]|nr:2-C-methyl-D-erythritol 4-phosphate cytidylyltransferase [Betaproteobacteria bacterium]